MSVSSEIDRTLDDLEKHKGEMSDLILNKSASYKPKSRSRRSHSRYERRKRRRSSISSGSASSESSDSEDSTDYLERKRFQRKVREKEMAYKKELRYWEPRERKKAEEYAEVERRKSDEYRKTRVDKLRKYLASYDDKRDDKRHYSEERMKEKRKVREKERKWESEDVWEEMHEIKMKEAQESKQSPLEIDEKPESTKEDEEKSSWKDLPPPPPPPGPSPAKNRKSDELIAKEQKEPRYEFSADDSEPKEMKPSTPIKVPLVLKPTPALLSAFGDVEEEMAPAPVAKTKLVPFEITAKERAEIMTREERDLLTKRIISCIPHDVVDIFAYPVAWEHLDNNIVQKKVEPWIQKKVVELIGHGNTDVGKYLTDKVANRVNPRELTDELAEILDKEAEIFVAKLWKLVIYETESKKLGIDTPVAKSSKPERTLRTPTSGHR